MDEDPPVDEEPPEGGEQPWDEPPTGESPPSWEEGEEPASADEPLWAERRPHADVPAPHGDHEPSPPPDDDVKGDADAPASQEELPVDDDEHEPLWGDDHPTSEQLPFEDGEIAGAGVAGGHEAGGGGAAAGEPEAGEEGSAEGAADGDHEEPPWGTGPPPWERGGFWGEEDEGEETAAAAAAAGAAAEGDAPLAAEDLTTRRSRQRVERRRAGQRRLAVLIAALVIVIVVVVVVTSGGSSPSGLGGNGGTTLGSKFAHAGKGPSHLKVDLGGSGLTENVLIADRNNSRLVSISPKGQVIYSLTQETPSDAYLSSTGHTVFVTEHEQSVVIERRVDNGDVSYIYGHSGKRGATDNRLHDPQSAQEATSGQLVIADRGNCRILFVDPNSGSHKPITQWGTTGSCTHHVSSQPFTFAFPDSAFAAANGDVVVTEQDPGWVDVLGKDGSLISAVALSDFHDPQDANEYATGKVIVVDRSRPGKVSEFDYDSAATTIVPQWSYGPSSGLGELNKPSLAIVLPNGNVMVADSGNDRVIIINPKLNKIVWQYGHKGKPGAGPGFLHTPDSIALVPNAPPG